jgi:hypothetical protein
MVCGVFIRCRAVRIDMIPESVPAGGTRISVEARQRSRLENCYSDFTSIATTFARSSRDTERRFGRRVVPERSRTRFFIDRFGPHYHLSSTARTEASSACCATASQSYRRARSWGRPEEHSYSVNTLGNIGSRPKSSTCR